jgi:hypothetical protein
MKVAALILGLAGAAPLSAQADARLQLLYPLQQRVRVAAPTLGIRPIVGRVEQVDSSHLSLRVTNAGTVVAIPLASVGAIEADLGIDRGKGAKRGALAGLGLGAYFFATEYPAIREHDLFGAGFLAMSLVSFGIAPGLGAIVGYAAAPRTWSRLAVPEPILAAAVSPGIQFAADEHVKLRSADATLSGRVSSQTRTLVVVSTKEATVPVPWTTVRRIQVRGGRDRLKGATAGALLFIGLGILGERTAPTTSTSERVGAFTGAALVGGYLGSKYLAPTGWTDVPVVVP